MPMLTLGLFIFDIQTAPYETLKRSTSARWASQNRIGQGPSQQFLGPGEDTITMDGTLFPEFTGGPLTLDALRTMMLTGKAWLLVAGTGEVMGRWIITQVDETKDKLFAKGVARKITFSLSLKRYFDEDKSMFGNLVDSKP